MLNAFLSDCVSVLPLWFCSSHIIFQSDSACGVNKSARGARSRSFSGSDSRLPAVFWCHTTVCIFLRLLLPLYELSALQHWWVCIKNTSLVPMGTFNSAFHLSGIGSPPTSWVFILDRDVFLHNVGHQSPLLLHRLAKKILCTFPIIPQGSPATHLTGPSAQYFLCLQ